jgi:hypothetical protein
MCSLMHPSFPRGYRTRRQLSLCRRRAAVVSAMTEYREFVFDLDRQTIYTSGALVRIRRVIAAIALEGMNPRSRT